MKKGSADDPFAEAPTAERETENDDATTSLEESGGDEQDSGAAESGTTASGNKDRSLPYIHARDGVKDGRKQRPIFLREAVEEGIDTLVDEMEEELDETVYKTDVTEAAMIVAQQNPELVRDELEEWGYGWS